MLFISPCTGYTCVRLLLVRREELLGFSYKVAIGRGHFIAELYIFDAK